MDPSSCLRASLVSYAMMAQSLFGSEFMASVGPCQASLGMVWKPVTAPYTGSAERAPIACAKGQSCVQVAIFRFKGTPKWLLLFSGPRAPNQGFTLAQNGNSHFWGPILPHAHFGMQSKNEDQADQHSARRAWRSAPRATWIPSKSCRRGVEAWSKQNRLMKP